MLQIEKVERNLDEIRNEQLDYVVRIPSPPILLKAKAANALELSQENREDIPHFKFLAAVVPQYFRKLHIQAIEKKISERHLVNKTGLPEQRNSRLPP